LPGIKQLAKDNPPCSNVQICVVLYYAGAFAAQFQRNGSKIPRCLFHYNSTKICTAREKNIIKAMIENFLNSLASPGIDADIFSVKGFINHVYDYIRYIFRIICWF